MSWRQEYDAMKTRLMRYGESDAEASQDAAQWADLVAYVCQENDTTQDDECTV